MYGGWMKMIAWLASVNRWSPTLVCMLTDLEERCTAEKA